MRVLVCGGRDFGNPDFADGRNQYNWADSKLKEIIYPLSEHYSPDDNWLPFDITIISGGAKGADRIGEDWAAVHYAGLKIFRADWNAHGKAAGMIRNQQMIDEGKPDMVIAFPGGRGTADMVKRAMREGITVVDLRDAYGETPGGPFRTVRGL